MRYYPVFTNFSGGLSEAAPDDMLDNELIEAMNAVPDVERGSISKCKGTVRVNEAPFPEGPAQVIIEFGREQGIAEYISFHENTMRLWNTNKKACEIGFGDNGIIMVMAYDIEEECVVEVNADLDEIRELKANLDDTDPNKTKIVVNLATEGEDLPTARIGSGEDGTVIIREKDPSTKEGSGYAVKVDIATTPDADLSVSLNEKLLTVTLGTDDEGNPDPNENSAKQIAEAINNITDTPFEASYSGTGEDVLTQAEAQKNLVTGHARASIGSGANGTVNIVMDEAGTQGNEYTVEVKIAEGKNKPLTATLTEKALVVTLATNSYGNPYNTRNTASRVAKAINAIEDKPFTAKATGTGGSALTQAEAEKNFEGGKNRLDEDANKAWKVARAIKDSAPNVSAAAKGTGEDSLTRAEAEKELIMVDEIIKDDLPGPPTDYDVYQDVLYWLDGENFWRYDGGYIKEVEKDEEGSETLWEYVKKCHFIEQRGQRHFFARPDSNEIYFSEIEKPNCILVNNRITAVTDDPDLVTGLKEFGGALLVFKRRSIYAWYGWDPDPVAGDVRFDKLTVHRGAISQWTIQRAESYLIYMADDGVYGLHTPYPNQISTIQLSDKKIGKTIKNALNKHLARACYYDKAYRLSICTEGDTNNVEYRYYPAINAWFGPFTHPVSWYLESLNGELYSAHPTKEFIFKHEQGYDYDDEPIHFRIKTRPIDILKGMILKSRVTRAYFAFRQYMKVDETSVNTVTIKVGYQEISKSLDTDESLVLGKAVFGETIIGWVDLIVKEVRLWAKGRRVQVTVENNRPGEPITLYGFAFGVTPITQEGSKFKVGEV